MRSAAAVADRAPPAHHPQFDPDRLARLPPAARQAFAHATSMNRPPHPSLNQRLATTSQRGGAISRRGGGFVGPTDSFVVLTESTIGAARSQPSAQLSAGGGNGEGALPGAQATSNAQTQRLTRLTRLFDLLSAVSDVDHPLCTDCGDILLELMSKQLAEAKLDRDRYVGFEHEVARERASEAKTVEALRGEVANVCLSSTAQGPF